MFFKNKLKVKSDVEINSVCPVCKYLARDLDDISSIQEHEACTECYNNFRFAMKHEWDNGERPTLEEARKRMNILINEV